MAFFESPSPPLITICQCFLFPPLPMTPPKCDKPFFWKVNYKILCGTFMMLKHKLYHNHKAKEINKQNIWVPLHLNETK